MARQIEATYSWMELIAYQIKTMERTFAMKALADVCALLKVQSTKVLEFCAREAIHIFGGSGYVKTGVGEKVERIYRDTQALSIPGGADEILTDFGARQSIKFAKKRFRL